jgi:hypothetical protein
MQRGRPPGAPSAKRSAFAIAFSWRYEARSLRLGELDAAVEALETGMNVERRANAITFEIKDGLDLAAALIRRNGPADPDRARSLLEELRKAARKHALEADLVRAEQLLSSCQAEHAN